MEDENIYIWLLGFHKFLSIHPPTGEAEPSPTPGLRVCAESSHQYDESPNCI